MIPEYYAIVYMYLFVAMERQIIKISIFQSFKALMYHHALGFNCMYVAFYI